MSQSMGKHQQRLDEAIRAAEASGSQKLGILVVEDDPDDQWRLARMLTLQGHRVVGTSSGGGALALVSEWPVDLVLVSEKVRGMTGVEVAERLEQDHPSIPVVLMTSEDEEPALAELAREKLANVVELLTKPFRREALDELLARFLPDLIPDPAE
jgi:two-component system response regulator GlrR